MKKSVSVVGVKYFDSYSACYSRNVIASGDVAECTQCGVMQKLQKCKAVNTTKLDIEVDGVIQCISVFFPVIELICQGEPSKIALISSADFDVVTRQEHCCFSTP
jgi:hypothetical protein